MFIRWWSSTYMRLGDIVYEMIVLNLYVVGRSLGYEKKLKTAVRGNILLQVWLAVVC